MKHLFPLRELYSFIQEALHRGVHKLGLDQGQVVVRIGHHHAPHVRSHLGEVPDGFLRRVRHLVIANEKQSGRRAVVVLGVVTAVRLCQQGRRNKAAALIAPERQHRVLRHVVDGGGISLDRDGGVPVQIPPYDGPRGEKVVEHGPEEDLRSGAPHAEGRQQDHPVDSVRVRRGVQGALPTPVRVPHEIDLRHRVASGSSVRFAFVLVFQHQQRGYQLIEPLHKIGRFRHWARIDAPTVVVDVIHGIYAKVCGQTSLQDRYLGQRSLRIARQQDQWWRWRWRWQFVLLCCCPLRLPLSLSSAKVAAEAVGPLIRTKVLP